jgi:hypothetical protein
MLITLFWCGCIQGLLQNVIHFLVMGKLKATLNDTLGEFPSNHNIKLTLLFMTSIQSVHHRMPPQIKSYGLNCVMPKLSLTYKILSED